MHTPSNRFPRGARRLLAPGWLCAVSVALLPGTGTAQEPKLVDTTRTTIEKWVETKSLLSKEKREWTLGRETLQDRIDVHAREIESLKKRIADAETKIAEADKLHGELAVEDARLGTSEQKLRQEIVVLEKRTRELLPRLPEPLREQLTPVSQLLPEKPEECKLRLDERYRNVLFVCRQIHKWNREVTVKSELRPLPDGSSVEVTVVYVGVGQGYYVGMKGTVAGTGTASPTGWVWTPANELAAEITAVVAVLKNEEVARFVRLPVQIL